MSGRIGVGAITCNRPIFFFECLKSIPENYDSLVVVNDGERSVRKFASKPGMILIEHEKNVGVGISKNDALKILLEENCEHLFLIEEDLKILNDAVFSAYINAYQASGIHHFSYGLGTPFNRAQDFTPRYEDGYSVIDQDGEPDPRIIASYGDEAQISFYRYPAGMFMYFSRAAVECAGMFDEIFYNAGEHIDLSFRITKAGFHPPFGYFADMRESYRYFEYLAGYQENRSVAPDAETWLKVAAVAESCFERKHGCSIYMNSETDRQEFVWILKELQQKYGTAGLELRIVGQGAGHRE